MDASWEKPQTGYVKVNCKGFFNMEKWFASVGCVIRDDMGRFVKAVEGRIGMVDPKTTEMWAIFHGLKLAWEKGETKMVVESESIEAVNNVINPNPFDPMFLLHKLMNNLLNEKWDDCKVVAIAKTANKVATVMAEHALDCENGVYELTDAPTAVKNIINDEM